LSRFSSTFINWENFKMLKKVLFALAALAVSGSALAQVDVNKADQVALDGIRGIGPAMSKAILDERKKGGEFKNWTDLEERVKGVGEKNAIRLSEAGLTVNGAPRQKAVAENKSDKKAKADAKDANKGARKEEPKK
jgi:competence protein ComEA